MVPRRYDMRRDESMRTGIYSLLLIELNCFIFILNGVSLQGNTLLFYFLNFNIDGMSFSLVLASGCQL